MDPNVALATLREAMEELRKISDVEEWDSSSEADERVDHEIIRATNAFSALDEWLSRDGFLPDDWLAEEDKPPHPEHDHCWDGCGLAVTHDGPCLDKPGGRVVCEHGMTCIHCGQEVKHGVGSSGHLLVDVRTEDWWCRANPSNGGDAAPHEVREV